MPASESRTEEAVAQQLLAVRGWDAARPPRGDVLRKNEYRQYPHLMERLAGHSKTGKGDGYPDFLVVDRASISPLIVIETKANEGDLSQAIQEAEHYARAFNGDGHPPLAIGVAGTDQTEIAVEVHKWGKNRWKPIEYRNHPIQWIPAPEEARRLLHDDSLFSLDPEVPAEDVLARYADQINRILRECRIKDEFRPAVVASFMLALWKLQGRIDTHPEVILQAINAGCQKAFEVTGKHEIAKSLKIPEENAALANRAAQICYILRLLNVTTLTAAHDYLGQLYETFFRFTGGNTIGQYFTPRHISKFVADLCEVSRQDKVLDPTCGTGGFLIAALYRMIGNENLTRQQLSALVRKHLMGFESEPITAALCVANMILRGDGATGIVNSDCFTSVEFPEQEMTLVLGNPPFPHKATDEPPEKFVDRGLEALVSRGQLAMLVPSSMLSKRDRQDWRKRVLKKNTLKAVIKVPDELFQPFASSYADIVILEKGVPHRADAKVFFGYISDDGYRIKKGVRIKRGDGDLPRVLKAYHDKKSIPGLCSFAKLTNLADGGEWGPGSYVEASEPSFEQITSEVAHLIRSQAAFQVQFSDKLAAMQEAIADGRLTVSRYDQLTSRSPYNSDKPNSLGRLFDIYYGMKDLHSKEGLVSGESMVVSSKGTDNGCFGFYNYPNLIQPPFISSPGTGSIGEASVQLFACGVTDDCVLLFPRAGTAPEELWTAAATIRRENWRFHYGFKLTPDRIKDYVIPRSPELTLTIREFLSNAMPVMRKLAGALGSFQGSAKHAASVEEEFRRNADKWQEDTQHLSNVTKRSIHPSYQRIIGMGEAVVPLILKELADRGPNDWFWALTAITGENPITEEIAGNMVKMTGVWLEWGMAAGYLTDYRQKKSGSFPTSSPPATK